ncbi:MAG: histidine kinase [Bacteroidota bacterium]
MLSKLDSFFRTDHAFVFLVTFRWAALLPALWMLVAGGTQPGPWNLWIFGAALAVNVAITLANRWLNRWVLRYPLLLGADLLFMGAILALSGGAHSPYYLYALSPLLAGAFLFQMRGALVVSLVFTPLYLVANALTSGGVSLSASDGVIVITELAGVWFLPVLFAYPARLLKILNQAGDDLARARDELAEKHEKLSLAHRQLEIIHDLTILLQAAPDLLSVQERVLGAVTADLGFPKAVVALVDPGRQELGNWVEYPAGDELPATEPLPLRPENGIVFQSILNRTSFQSCAEHEPLVLHDELNAWLNRRSWLILPLFLREHSVGVLFVAIDGEKAFTKEREATVSTVASQAALALGTTILCIDRARRLAVEQERNRIARDIHDTVAQSLFGIVYSLDACVNMLPAQADEVRNELIDLRTLAGNAHEEVRRSIFDLWPSALTLDVFTADLTGYVNSCCRPRSFGVDFHISGDFERLPAGVKRTVYRMTQEALSNSARYSGAPSAQVFMEIAQDQIHLNIADQGRGFDPASMLSHSQNREHFGLRGIQERAQGMGGHCQIYSSPGQGARIVIDLPLIAPDTQSG